MALPVTPTKTLYFDGQPVVPRFAEGGFTQVRSTSTHTEIIGMAGTMYSIPNIVVEKPTYRQVKLTNEDGKTIYLEVSNKDNTVSVDVDALLEILAMAGFEGGVA